uniref:Uncharacterized protein n=1 Tax=Mus musculus TaxID=10090 RepID=Q3UVD2_MOUSE|nr:unnamed protein product [Mus musculus]
MKTPLHRTPHSARPGCGCPEGGWGRSGQPYPPPPLRPRRRRRHPLAAAAPHSSRRLRGSLDGRPSERRADPRWAPAPGTRRTGAGRARNLAPPGVPGPLTASPGSSACPPKCPAPAHGRCCRSKSLGTLGDDGSRPQRSQPLPPRTASGLRAASRAFGTACR